MRRFKRPKYDAPKEYTQLVEANRALLRRIEAALDEHIQKANAQPQGPHGGDCGDLMYMKSQLEFIERWNEPAAELNYF